MCFKFLLQRPRDARKKMVRGQAAQLSLEGALPTWFHLLFRDMFHSPSTFNASTFNASNPSLVSNYHVPVQLRIATQSFFLQSSNRAEEPETDGTLKLSFSCGTLPSLWGWTATGSFPLQLVSSLPLWNTSLLQRILSSSLALLRGTPHFAQPPNLHCEGTGPSHIHTHAFTHTHIHLHVYIQTHSHICSYTHIFVHSSCTYMY